MNDRRTNIFVQFFSFFVEICHSFKMYERVGQAVIMCTLHTRKRINLPSMAINYRNWLNAKFVWLVCVCVFFVIIFSLWNVEQTKLYVSIVRVCICVYTYMCLCVRTRTAKVNVYPDFVGGFVMYGNRSSLCVYNRCFRCYISMLFNFFI